MPLLNVEQGSPEWIAARVGSLGASRLHEAVAKTKTGYSASRENLMAELIVERLTGQPAPQFQNAAMQWGSATEPDARSAYEFMTNRGVQLVGLYRHPTIPGTHASPDGLIEAEGLLECKCPNTATHIETLLGASIDRKYLVQMQWQMACAERQWTDFVSFDPRLPDTMRLHIRRVPRDQKMIDELTAEASAFLAELDKKLARLKELNQSTVLAA